MVGGGAMLPDGVGDGFQRRCLELRLGKQSAEEPAQQVSTSTLGQVRVAGAIDEQVAPALADNGLMPLSTT